MFKNRTLEDNGCLTAIFYALITIVVIIALSVLFSLPIKWLWNWLMPTIFNLPTMSWLQALGLSVLSGFLIRGVNTSNNNK